VCISCKFIASTEVGEYYLGYFNSVTAEKLSVVLINTIAEPVNFTIEAPVAGFYYAGVVDGESEDVLNLPSNVVMSPNDTQYKGIYIRVERDDFIVIGQSDSNGTGETFLALPYKRSSVITEHVYYGISAPGYTPSHQGVILIVGTEDNTTMKLTVTQTATTNTGITLYTGREYSFVINRLQTFYIRSTGDLTGTKIVTDKQVSVFSGHELAQIPQDICCGDLLIEQVPPVTSWGRVFYTMSLATRKSYTIKILASHNATEIGLYCNNLEKSHIINEEFHTMNEGQHYTKTLSQQEYCAIHSSKPVLVAQFSHGHDEDGVGGPMMMIVPDVLQFSNRFPVTTIRNATRTGYNNYINIIVLSQYYKPDMIELISEQRNMYLNNQQWVPIKVKHTTEAYATQLTISEGVAELFHADTNVLMLASMYGFIKYGSYGHPGRPSYLKGMALFSLHKYIWYSIITLYITSPY